MDDVNSLQAALDDFNAAWAAQDIEGLVRQFVPDDNVVIIGSQKGEKARGLEELRRLIEHFFSEPISYSWEWDRRDVYATDDIGLIVATGDIIARGLEDETRTEFTITGVLERRDGRWLWRLFHGSEPKEPQADWDRIVRSG